MKNTLLNKILNPALYFSIPLYFLLSFIIQFESETLTDLDGFYHIKIADLYYYNGILTSFPWTKFSMFYYSFSDKDFLFHVFLIPFTFIEMIFGAKLAVVVLNTIFLTAVQSFFDKEKIRGSILWAILLVFGSPHFIFRFTMLRSHLLSMILIVVFIYFLVNKKNIQILIVSFLYALSYTAFHFLFIISLIYSFSYLLENRKFLLKPVIYTIAGIIVGLILHPHFPENIEIFYLQNFKYLQIAWEGGDTIIRQLLGTEIVPVSGKTILFSLMPLLLISSGSLILCLLKSMRSDEKLLFYFILFLCLFSLTMLSLRFVEYFVPVSIIFCAYLFEKLVNENLIKFKIFLCILLIMIFASCFRSIRHFPAMFHKQSVYSEDFRKVFVQNANDGSLVFTYDWESIPELLFYNDRVTYLVVLDPLYFYYAHPSEFLLWRKILEGKEKDPIPLLKNVFGANWLVLRNDFKEFKAYLDSKPEVHKLFDDGYHSFYRL